MIDLLSEFANSLTWRHEDEVDQRHRDEGRCDADLLRLHDRRSHFEWLLLHT